MVQFLLSRGADIFVKSAAEMTAFTIAVKEGNMALLEIFQHEILQRKEESKPSFPVPLLEVPHKVLPELSQKAKERLSLVEEKIEYNEVKGKFYINENFNSLDMCEKLCQPSDEFRLRVLNIYHVNAPNQYKNYQSYKRSLENPDRTAVKFYGHDLYFIDHAIHTSFLLSKQVGNRLVGKFGLGAYFTTDATQSAIHSSEHNRYLLLCEVALGTYWTIHCPMQHLNLDEVKAFKYDSVYGLRNSEKHGGVKNDHFIVYHHYQAVPLYLIEYEKKL